MKFSGTSCWKKTNDSLIFSFTNKSIKDTISNVINVNCAIYYSATSGPSFGGDIIIYNSTSLTDYNIIRCKKKYYEKNMRFRRLFFYRGL